MALDFIGGVILIAAVVVNISVFANALGISQPARIGFVAVAGLWTGLQLSLYAAGAYQSPVVQTFPLIGPMVVLPPIIAGVAAIFSQRVRAILLAVPTELLIGLNAMRVFGAFFLLLAAAGRLSGPFPYFAGWGDVITGLVAIPLAMHVVRGSASPARIFAWNAFGMLDLITAVTLGTLSSDGFVAQVFNGNPGSAAVQHMPWLLIPTVLVPFYLITHGIIFAQLRHRAASVATQRA
jgi:hypothetical protein